MEKNLKNVLINEVILPSKKDSDFSYLENLDLTLILAEIDDDVLFEYMIEKELSNKNLKTLISKFDENELLEHINDWDIFEYIKDNYNTDQIMDEFDIEQEVEVEDGYYGMYKENVIEKINELSSKVGFLKILNHLETI